jgi:hypothetical protein
VIYLCFYRIIIIYDRSVSRIKPKAFAVTFMTSDFLCLVLQAAGGAITATTGGASKEAAAMRNTGINVMIAGLALQVVSLLLFIGCALDYAWFLSRKGFVPALTTKQSRRWKGLLIGEHVVNRALQTLLISAL